MKRFALIGILALAACGGGHKQAAAPAPAAASTASATANGHVIVVGDIDCVKLVNHMVDIHAAANAEKAAANPDAVAKIRADTIKECDDRWTRTPPTDAEKKSAQCSMDAQTTDALEACGA
jgi:hypothetical protein